MRALQLLVASCVISVASSFLSGAEPELSRITPPGFQRGTEIEVELSGNRLQDAEGVYFYEPGVELVGIEKPESRKVKLKLKVSPDCRLGQHALRVRTKSGITMPALFYVGALPELKEVEPNSSFNEPQKVEFNTTINGVVDREDVDYFAVDVKKGDRITAELAGLRLGRTFFDSYIAILNSQRFELARSDDEVLVYQDGICSVIAPEDGTYIIEVRESSYGGSGSCQYRLSVGNFPRPLGIFPTGGKPGEEMEIQLLGEADGPRMAKVTLPQEEGEFLYYCEDDRGVAPTPNRLYVSALPTVIEQEPNNERKEATEIQIPGSASGIIEEVKDYDYFKFQAKKGIEYRVDVRAREGLRSHLDPVLDVYREDGKRLNGSDDSNGNVDSEVRFRAPADEWVYCRVRDHLGSGSLLNVYRVEVDQTKPSLTLGLDESRRYISETLNIPQGNQMAVLVNAKREKFGSDLELLLENLPPGVEATTIPMIERESKVPVLFSAKEDSELQGSLATITGKATKEGVDVVGNLTQSSMLVRGQNNRPMWSHVSNKLAVAVTEKVPFKLEIVEPKVPIVRDGSMKLKVKATREDDFKGDIRLRVIHNPPGIGSSRSIVIKGDADEAEIPLTANGGAAIGDWKLCVIGRAAHKSGSVEVATPFADLQIADQYFDMKFNKAAAELGQTASVLIGLNPKQEFEGEAELQLLGLPKGATAEPTKITKDSKEATFSVKIAEDAKTGKHTSIVARLTIVKNEEPIIQTNGRIELRIDKPLPVKVAAKPTEKKKKAEPAPKKERPLTRLEQLRLAKEQQKK